MTGPRAKEKGDGFAVSKKTGILMGIAMSWRHKTYEVLPALSVRGPNLRSSLRTVTMAWMFGVVWMSCIFGAHVKTFTRMLGFNDFAFGLMAAMPFLATFGQIPATILIERTGLRKFQFLQTVTISRALWFAIAAIPLLLPIPSKTAVVMMLALLWVAWFMAALGEPAWYTWMGDLIPKRIRGRFLANRNRICQVVRIVVVIALGIILDRATIKGTPETREAQPVLLYVTCGIFFVAAIFGVTDILLFRRIREVIPTTRDKPRRPAVDIRVPAATDRRADHVLGYWMRYAVAAVRQIIIEPLGDRVFRRYVAYRMAMTFAMATGGMFFILNAMENLGFSKLGTNVLFMVIIPLVGIAAAKGWGKLIDHWGRRPTLMLAGILIVVSIIPWFFATRDTPHPGFLADGINWVSRTVGAPFGAGTTLVSDATPLGAYLLGILGCAVGGAGWTGVMLAQTGMMLGFSDGEGRSKYLAGSAVLISVGGVLGGVAAGVLTQSLGFMQDNPIGPFAWNNWHAAFGLSMLGRIAGLLLLINMPDPGSGRVRDLVRSMGVNAYNTLNPRLFYRLRTIGWRSRKENGSDDLQ